MSTNFACVSFLDLSSSDAQCHVVSSPPPTSKKSEASLFKAFFLQSRDIFLILVIVAGSIGQWTKSLQLFVTEYCMLALCLFEVLKRHSSFAARNWEVSVQKFWASPVWENELDKSSESHKSSQNHMVITFLKVQCPADSIFSIYIMQRWKHFFYNLK